MRQFPTMQHVARASEKKLSKVVGPVAAKRVYIFFNRKEFK
jgi:hypothetical protein